MTAGGEFRISCAIRPDTARRMRHAFGAFLDVLEVEQETAEDILMAIGEALANSVEHAYGFASLGEIELHAQSEDDKTLAVVVADRGTFVERERRPDRGFGLSIIRAIARRVVVERDNGTRVQMVFDR